VPGYQVPFTRATDRNHATIDILGLVRDEAGRPAGRIRDTVKIAADRTDDLQRKTVQYESGLELGPGTYHLKVVVRENQNGTMGSYETDVVVPSLARDGIKTSSIVVGTELRSGAHTNARNPLIRDSRELVPNVTHVVSTSQHLYFYYEVYDPARASGAAASAASAVKVVTSLTFFRNKVRVFETPPVEASALNGSDRQSTFFQFDVPAASLPQGLYTCQVNIIDDVAGTFAFPRLQLYVRR